MMIIKCSGLGQNQEEQQSVYHEVSLSGPFTSAATDNLEAHQNQRSSCSTKGDSGQRWLIVESQVGIQPGVLTHSMNI